MNAATEVNRESHNFPPQSFSGMQLYKQSARVVVAGMKTGNTGREVSGRMYVACRWKSMRSWVTTLQPCNVCLVWSGVGLLHPWMICFSAVEVQ